MNVTGEIMRSAVYHRFMALIVLCVLMVGASTALAAPALAPASAPAQPSLEVMAGQMIMVGFRGTGEDLTKGDLPRLLGDISAGRVGGVILFDYDVESKTYGRNIRSAAQIRHLIQALQQKAPIPLFISVDQEGGKVRRLKPDMHVPDTPSALTLAKQGPEGVRTAALSMGKALKALGINMNFAPVTDVAINPQSPAIGKVERAFSGNAQEVAHLARPFAEGLGQSGVIAAYKHFPGHGSASGDTHFALADISSTWKPEELLPYTKEQRPTVPMVVMVGHLFHRELDSRLPASLSPAVINGILRGQLGWQGVVITDDMQMRALTASYSLREIILYAVQAGVDILLNGNNMAHHPQMASVMFDTLLTLVKEGHIKPERIALSYERIMKLKAQSGLL